MCRGVLELKFKGKRRLRQLRRRWFSKLLEDEEKKDLARNRKVKTEDFSTIDPYKMDTVVEEEEEDEDVMKVLT
jgi:hypothetical protein